MTTLTDREIQIVLLVWADLTNKTIAEKLQLSESTVENHLHNIYTKLNVGSRIGLVKKAMLIGLIS